MTQELYPDRGTTNITEDGKLYTCSKCGFPCDRDKVLVVKKGTNAGESITITNGDPTVEKGCPFCGTLLSRKI